MTDTAESLEHPATPATPATLETPDAAGADESAARPAPRAPAADRARPRGSGVIPQTRSSVTLVEGSSFCVSDTGGDIRPHEAHGLFVRDTRIVSSWELRIDGAPVEPLSVLPGEPYAARFIGRAPTRPGQVEPTIVVERHRLIGRGMREDLTVTNHAMEAAGLDLEILVDADFAGLFEVKDRRPTSARPPSAERLPDGLRLRSDSVGGRGVRISAPGAQPGHRALMFRIVVGAGESWHGSVEVLPEVDGTELSASFPLDRPISATEPAQRMRGWTDSSPRIEVDSSVLEQALAISRQDLGALRIKDPDHPEDDAVAAGAPWFMALFGRDSLLTSWMMLPYTPGLTMGTLRTLARLQGREVSAMREEEPGRILHEVRLGADLSLAPGGDGIYYGSIDSTPLFVALVGRAAQWGVPRTEIDQLRPAVEAALTWIQEYGDRDGDGFVEYQRATDRGLQNQGWKDSLDSICDEHGHEVSTPIALAEVQGYCYAAFLAGAVLFEIWGEQQRAEQLRERAAALKARFHDAFWQEDLGFYAMALDGAKRPVRVLSSNIGHCLLSGIVEESVADRVIDRLLEPEMFTGFGIRTLSSAALRYNPASYHNGSVWPHDTVLGAAGMARYGRRDAATAVVDGLLDALEAFDGRLPELFCGFSRQEAPMPVPYPTSCSPQAWAAATPFEMLRIALGLEADVPGGRFVAAPTPASVGRASLQGLPVAGGELTVAADAYAVSVDGLPAGIRQEEHARAQG
ncbi:glycogen debranching N-terminal domain-containing protein [Brachybacterium sp. GCM10030252]|uniref:amylo-alpha-1,6-glucosidase n=1 Tax=Brachybacterium sp. GCM10030252 TaxID=3273380 RepID=UPI0036169170